MALTPLEITLEDLWVDLCDLGEADFVGFRSRRAGSWSFRGSACKIYFKLGKRGRKM
jgi:hypothetical protein